MNKRAQTFGFWIFVILLIMLFTWVIALCAVKDDAIDFCYPYVIEGNPHKIHGTDMYTVNCAGKFHNITYVWDACASKDKHGFCESGSIFKESYDCLKTSGLVCHRIACSWTTVFADTESCEALKNASS